MKAKLLILIATVALSSTACKQEKQVDNTDAHTYAKTREFANLWFHHSAEMHAIYLQTYKFATLALDKELVDYKYAMKPAVVLDLDETVLDNSPYQFKLIEQKSEYTFENWTAWVNLAIAKALPGSQEFTSYAKERGVEVFYISNRSVQNLDSTISNLQKLNFVNADSSHVLLKEKTGDKTARRAKVSENYEIILLLGDNLADFSHDFAKRNKETMGKDVVEANKDLFGERYIIFPNPMYGEWEKALYDNSYKWTETQKDSLRAMLMKPGY